MNITYSAARLAIWANAEQTMIDLEVDFDHEEEDWVMFTAV